MPKTAEKTVAQRLGEEIRRRREAKDWPRSRLAEEAKISSPTVATAEAGDNPPTVETLHRIATALGCKPSAIWRAAGM